MYLSKSVECKAVSAVITHRFIKEHMETAFIQKTYQVKNQPEAQTGELV